MKFDTTIGADGGPLPPPPSSLPPSLLLLLPLPGRRSADPGGTEIERSDVVANLVIASNSKAMSKLDGSIKKKVYEFFEKLNTDDTSPALHIEPMRVATDPRVRTGRVDIHYRAVFKVDDKPAPRPHLHGDLEPRRCDQTCRKGNAARQSHQWNP